MAEIEFHRTRPQYPRSDLSEFFRTFAAVCRWAFEVDRTYRARGTSALDQWMTADDSGQQSATFSMSRAAR